MLITNGTISQTGMRRRTITRQVSLGPISLRIVTILIIGAAVLTALMQSTSAATKNYALSRLEDQKSAKLEDLDVTNADIARLRALNNNSILKLDPSLPTPSPSPSPASLVAPTKINALNGETNSVSFLP